MSHKLAVTNKGGNYKTQYLLRIGSHEIFNQLSAFGLIPHKSLTIAVPKIPSACFSAFILGYFDGDGCVHIEKSILRKSKRLLTVFKRE